MADQVLTLKQIEDFFVKITCDMLGLDMTKTINFGKVRKAWPTDGAPSWKISEDIVFLRITPIDDKMARQLNIIYDPNKSDITMADKKTGYTRVHKVDWTLYGPNSYDNPDIIRISIFDSNLMMEMQKKNLALITDVSMPARIPELYNNQWWERTDFSATFNEAVIREKQVPYILSTDIRTITNR